MIIVRVHEKYYVYYAFWCWFLFDFCWLFYSVYFKNIVSAKNISGNERAMNEFHFQFDLTYTVDIIYFLWAHDRSDIDQVQS